MSEARKSQYAMKTTYTKGDVEFVCNLFGETVQLDCEWYLDVDQGSEGFLSTCSTRVQCSAADRCTVLAKGRCPLADVRQDVLNEMEIRVLEGEPYLRLEDDGTVWEAGAAREKGHVIWFGATTVVGKDGARNRPWE